MTGTMITAAPTDLELARIRKVKQDIEELYQGIKVERIGAYAWISGETYQYRKNLKEYELDGLTLKWAPKKKKWFFDNGRKRSTRRDWTEEELKETWGTD